MFTFAKILIVFLIILIPISGHSNTGKEAQVLEQYKSIPALSSIKDSQITHQWISEGVVYFEFENASFGMILSTELDPTINHGEPSANLPSVSIGSNATFTPDESSQGDQYFYATGDTYIVSASPNSNFNGLPWIEAGWLQETNTMYALVKSQPFQVDGTITDATLWMDVVQCFGTIPTNSEMRAHKITNSWSQSNVTWQSQPAFQAAWQHSSTISSCPSIQAWDVWDAATEWNQTPSSNHGILIKQPPNPDAFSIRYASSDSSSHVAPFFYVEFMATPTYSLNVNASGASSVNISSSPSGYGGTTNYTVSSIDEGTSFSLTAPLTWGGAEFNGWSGCNSTSGTSGQVCNVTMNNNRTVTSNYSTPTPTYNLTVNSSGANSVNISSSPSGYGGTTNYTVSSIDEGTSFSLTAPLTWGGAEFNGWSGCNSTSGASGQVCNVTMNSNRTVTSNFSTPTPTYNLTVNSSGASSVNISSSPSGYGGTTNYTVSSIDEGTSFSLTAPLTWGSAEFNGWSGCNSTSGTSGRTCNVTMNGNRTVTTQYSTATETCETQGVDNEIISSMVTISACALATAGPNVVVTVQGNLRLEAGEAASISEMLLVEQGGSLEISTCGHTLCEVGDPFDDQCHSCVEAVCAADSYCCNTFWDQICVNQVSTVCSLNCAD